MTKQVASCRFLLWNQLITVNSDRLAFLLPANEVAGRLCFYTCLWFCSFGGVSHGRSHGTPPGQTNPPPLRWSMSGRNAFLSTLRLATIRPHPLIPLTLTSNERSKTISPALLPPATKLGQGNIFRSVYQEFCPQGGWYPSIHCRSAGPHPGEKLRGLAGGVSRPTPRGGEVEGSGLGVLQAHTRGGVSQHAVSQHALRKTPPPKSRRLLLRAVRILLEYILVLFIILLTFIVHHFTLGTNLFTTKTKVSAT